VFFTTILSNKFAVRNEHQRSHHTPNASLHYLVNLVSFRISELQGNFEYYVADYIL